MQSAVETRVFYRQTNRQSRNRLSCKEPVQSVLLKSAVFFPLFFFFFNGQSEREQEREKERERLKLLAGPIDPLLKSDISNYYNGKNCKIVIDSDGLLVYAIKRRKKVMERERRVESRDEMIEQNRICDANSGGVDWQTERTGNEKVGPQWSAAFEVISRHYACGDACHFRSGRPRSISVNRCAAVDTRFHRVRVRRCSCKRWRRAAQFTGDIIISRGLVLLIIPHGQGITRVPLMRNQGHALLPAQIHVTFISFVRDVLRHCSQNGEQKVSSMRRFFDRKWSHVCSFSN